MSTPSNTPGEASDPKIASDSARPADTAKLKATPPKTRKVKLKDGASSMASVALFSLRDLGNQDADTAFAAIWRLHRILEESFGDQPAIRITSALYGAVVVVLEAVEGRPAPDLREMLPSVISRINDFKLPIRIGVTHGVVEYLEDADDRGNFIGPAVNIAARIAAPKKTDENPGLLFEESFKAACSARVLSKEALKIGDTEIAVGGKEHDQRPFSCFEAVHEVRFGTGYAGIDRLGKPDPGEQPQGLAVAFDLPQFSAGDRSQMGHRFRGFVDQYKKIRRGFSNGKVYYSPGGDGGILVFTGEHAIADGLKAALALDRCLKIEDIDQGKGAGLQCRFGVHYGVVPLYPNAEGVWRPTGRVLFVADNLASDQNPGVIVYSHLLKDPVSEGSTKAFAAEYKPLDPIDCPPDGMIGRFVAAQYVPPATSQVSPHTASKETVKSTFGKCIEDMAALFRTKPKLFEKLRAIFNLDSGDNHEAVATNLTLWIISRFEEAFDKVIDCRSVDSEVSVGLEEFVRLILPLSVSIGRLIEPGNDPEVRPLQLSTTNLAADLDRSALAGRPLEGSLSDFRPGLRRRHELDASVPAGPCAEENLADLRDELRERLGAELRRQLTDAIGAKGFVHDVVLAGYLERQSRRAPNPYFVILEERQRRMRDWIAEDPVLRKLLVYQRGDLADPVLTINEGALVEMVEEFVESTRKTQNRSSKT